MFHISNAAVGVHGTQAVGSCRSCPICDLLCVWVQLPAQIELNTLAEDGNKIKTTVGDVVKGKKVSIIAH